MNYTLQHHNCSLVLKSNSAKRFDIIIFNGNKLTGETVCYKKNQLFINNKQVREPFDLKNRVHTGDFSYKLNRNEFFVLGDNRGNSIDSRHFGCINKRDIVGKMIYRFFPLHSIGKIN